ncbi:MAG TPA: DNA-processing protein DprA [Nocardioides sp.]|nr:DNA-processing protein DprA [Nocardioides sp.]
MEPTGEASPEERLARVALSRLSEPGEPRLAALVDELGAHQVFELLRSERDVRGVYTDVAQRLEQVHPERELDDAAGRGFRFVCPGDREWPHDALVGLASAGVAHGRGGPPLGLWLRGPLRLDEVTGRSVAVVGSRSATTYGASVAGGMAADLVRDEVAVVSGAAYGIDVAAHRGALAAGGPTVAVLACGVDRAYPAGNQGVIDHLARHSLVVSEVPPGSAPTRLRFLSRNRIIAALGTGTVVVEAAVRSGALSTASWATRLGRVLMGVPGPVTSAPSAGVHELLRRGQAQLVTSAAHVLELVGPVGSFLVPRPTGERRRHDGLGPEHLQVLDAVPVRTPAPVAAVARTAGLGVRATEGALAHLARLGLVRGGPGGWIVSAPATRPEERPATAGPP